MAHLDYTSLRLFGSVIECGNIAQAARINNIAASAISKRISDLEYRLRTPLIYRHRDGVSPTNAGKVLYKHIRILSEAMGHLEADMSEFTSGYKGQIKLWANTSAITEFLPEDLKDFVDKYPDVIIDLREDTSDRIIEAIKNGDTDIGIFSSHSDNSNINKRVYRRDTLVVIVPQGHPLEKQKSLKLADTVQYEQIGMQSGSSLQNKISDIAQQYDLDIHFKVKVFSFDGVRRMVEAGLGISILPLGAIEQHLEHTTFVVIPLDEPWAKRTLYVGYKDYKNLLVVARHLIDTLAPSVD